MSGNDGRSGPPRVFISYSHDSPEHAERVLALARQLRGDGIDARFDRFVADSPQGPPEGWPHWCAEQILAADVTLLVCTATSSLSRPRSASRPATGPVGRQHPH